MVKLHHKIKQGEPVLLDNKAGISLLERQDPNVIISVLLTLIQKKLPKYVNANHMISRYSHRCGKDCWELKG